MALDFGVRNSCFVRPAGHERKYVPRILELIAMKLSRTFMNVHERSWTMIAEQAFMTRLHNMKVSYERS